MLTWNSLSTSRDPKHLVKGTELAQAMCGTKSRFAIVEVRALDSDGNLDVVYRVRDAETVSDAEVKVGTRPKVVGTFRTLDEAMAFVMEQGALDELAYRDHVITHWAKPIPDRRHDYDYQHVDFDGDEDNRCGSMESVKACMQEIDDWHSDQEA